MSTCEHKGPGPCRICEHVEQASIPSSPILDFEKARSSAAIGPHGEIHPGIEEHILESQAQAAVSPLLAEIEMFRASCAQYVRRIAELNDENQGKQDRLNKLYLIESNLYERLDRAEAEARDRQSEVVRQVNAKLAAQEEAQKLREALREVVRLCESAGVRNLANGVELGAMSWLMKITDAIAEARKALGGSK